MSKQWHVIYMYSPKNLGIIRSCFNRLGIDLVKPPFMPVQQVVQKNGNTVEDYLPRGWRPGMQKNTREIFHHYVFVYFDYNGDSIDQQLTETKSGYLLKLPGCDLPAVISEEDIQRFHDMEGVRVEESLEESRPKYAVGTMVEVTNGAFLHSRGTITSVKRHKVTIEISVLGRSCPVEVNAANVYPVTNE
jgi:transcription antitermination factor NusG